MEKNLSNFVSKYNLNCENKDKLVYGIFNGYQMSTTIDVFQANSFHTFIFTKMNEELATKLRDFLNANLKVLKLVQSNFYNYGFSFAVQTITRKSGYANLENALLKITEFLNENGFMNQEYCPICGNEMMVKKTIKINDVKFNVDEVCEEELKSQLQANEEAYENAPNNYFAGFIGAALGGLVGALVWIFVGVVFNLMSAWIALLLSWLAGNGYTKAKGKANVMKIVISSVVSVIYIIVSMLIVYNVLCVKEGLDLVALLNENIEFKAAFIGDMVQSLLFGALGIVFAAIQMKKTLHKKQDI